MTRTAGLSRKDVIARVVAMAGDNPIVANVGSASYYLYEVEDRALNFYTFGALGQVGGISLGLAAARPDRDIITIDGDGSLLMNLSILAVIGCEQPSNFLHIVLDDGAYESTGGQPTATRETVSLEEVARGCGISQAHRVTTFEELEVHLRAWEHDGGPVMLVVEVPTERGNVRPRFDQVYYKYRFMDALNGIENGVGQIQSGPCRAL